MILGICFSSQVYGLDEVCRPLHREMWQSDVDDVPESQAAADHNSGQLRITGANQITISRTPANLNKAVVATMFPPTLNSGESSSG